LRRAVLARGTVVRRKGRVAAGHPVTAVLRVRDARLRRLRRGLGSNLVVFQQRVALNLGLDEGAQLDVGQLEQAYCLLQLRCHHQLLALPELQFGHKRHNTLDRRQDASRGQVIRSPH